jgi:hypothetical protein
METGAGGNIGDNCVLPLRGLWNMEYWKMIFRGGQKGDWGQGGAGVQSTLFYCVPFSIVFILKVNKMILK